jgi:hypothetical protein
MGSHPVAVQKQEALACFLSDAPASIKIPMTEKVIASPAGKGASTLNKSFLAAIVASVARPGEVYYVGRGWEGDHHGGPRLGRLDGTNRTGAFLGLEAMLGEVYFGIQGGGREFHGGYAVDVYYVGYMLALRRGSTEMRRSAARALAANLAIDYLLTVPTTGEVIEIGGRATGGANTYSPIIQALWNGEDVRVPESDAGIACQMFAELTAEERAMLPDFPGSVGEAVEILRGSEVVCPARFEWWGENGWWRAQVNRERSWFIQKRTGFEALMVISRPRSGYMSYPDSHRSRVVESYDWHITLTETGLAVHRRPGGEEPKSDPGDKPTPSRPPEPPDPELPDPLDEGEELAKALAEWGDREKFNPARKWAREVRRAIREERKRRREGS